MENLWKSRAYGFAVSCIGAWSLVGSLESSSLWAKVCSDLLKQYNPRSEAVVTTGTLKTFPELQKPVLGEDSKENFTPEWTMKAAKGRGYIEFAFIPTSGPGAQRVPYMTVHFNEAIKSRPAGENPKEVVTQVHDIRIQFPRDQNGDIRDKNLLSKSFEHLFRLAEAHDQFSWVIEEPELLDKFYKIIQERLAQMYYYGPPPEPLQQSQGEFNSLRDLRWEGVLESEMSSIYSQIREGTFLDELTAAFESSAMAKALRASGDWRFQIETKLFMLNYHGHEEAYQGPYRLEFRLLLEPYW